MCVLITFWKKNDDSFFNSYSLLSAVLKENERLFNHYLIIISKERSPINKNLLFLLKYLCKKR